jgi:GpV Apex motif
MAESINQRINYVPDDLTGNELRALLQSVLTDLAALRTALNAHTHGGVTTGAGTSGAANASTMGTLNTLA